LKKQAFILAFFLNSVIIFTMYEIVRKKALNPTVTEMDISAPLVAKKAEAGQFIILRVDDDGERIPLTVAGYDREAGTVKIIFQIVGGTTMRLNAKNEGDYIADFVGPLGCATRTEGLQKVCIVGGGVGCAIALPVAQKLHALGCEVHSVIGFRNKDLLILQDEFAACSDKLTIMTDDGSYGRQGVVTAPLKEAIENGENYDEVIAIGPLIMMKFVVATTKPYGVKTTVSMNPIMIDGTGMCGGCRLTVGGKTKFACVDGPDFNGFEVDFDEAMARSNAYADFEKHAREESCNLYKKEVR
jgi:ferredoxin--NADP+ reductase